MARKKGVEKALASLEKARAKVPPVRALVSQTSFPYRAPTTPLTVEPAPAEQKLLGHYDSDWARKLPARYARFFLTEGLVRPVIAGLLITSLPEPHRHQVFAAAAADYFFDSRIKATASALVLNAIPIERNKVGRRSADQAAELLDDGWSMIIFPEGGRSPDGWGQPFRGGAAYLAIRCDVPVVPIHIAGTGRILPKGKSRPKPQRTVVTFGTPIRAAEGERSGPLGERIEAAVAALADEATTDWYSARRRAAAGETPTLAGPQSGAWRRTWALTAQRKKPSTSKRWPEL